MYFRGQALARDGWRVRKNALSICLVQYHLDIHTHARTHVHARTHTHTHTHARTHAHTHTRTRTHACKYARTHTHICTPLYACEVVNPSQTDRQTDIKTARQTVSQTGGTSELFVQGTSRTVGGYTLCPLVINPATHHQTICRGYSLCCTSGRVHDAR